jgi:hypothetical protein
MTTTPRSHQPNPRRTPTPAAAAGPQDLDDVDADADPDDLKTAEATTSTESGVDVGRETGELYGQGIAPTGDIDDDGVRAPQDYDDDEGETWTEALITSAAEHGTAGEAAIDDVRGTEAEDREPDDDDDRPPADLGAGGPAGL